MGYSVSCAACDLEETFETVDEVLDRQAEHRAERTREHVLEFEVER